jgi:chromosome segregation ATPase
MSSSVEFLLQKYGISPKSSQPRPSNLSQGSLESPIDLKTSPMRSSELSPSLEIDLQRCKSEITDLKSQITSLKLQKEKEVTLKVMESESDLKLQLGRNQNLEDQIIFLKSQLEFFESESRRSHDQFLIEKESWVLQTENLKRQLQYKQIEGNSSSSSVKLEKEENRILREQLVHLKKNEQELLNERAELKRELERERNRLKETVEIKDIEVKSHLGEAELNLQQVRLENEKLHQLCTELNLNLNEKDRKIKELETVVRLSEEAREALKKQQMATQDFIKDVVSVNEQLVDSLQKDPKSRKKRSTSARKNKSSPSLRSSKDEEPSMRKKVSVPSYLNKEGKLQDTIQTLEEEISEINNKYKRLVAKTQDGTSDYLKSKEEIDRLAKSIDEKSKTLFAAKRRYSSMVREKIINEAIN